MLKTIDLFRSIECSIKVLHVNIHVISHYLLLQKTILKQNYLLEQHKLRGILLLDG